MLRQALFIGAAGFIGAIARYAVSSIVSSVAPRQFPYGTLTVNVTGCLLLAIFLTLFRDRAASDALRLAIAVGFLGAYTTFSTFAMELYDMGKTQRVGAAIGYAALSLTLGLIAVWAGVRLAHVVEKLLRVAEQ